MSKLSHSSFEVFEQKKLVDGRKTTRINLMISDYTHLINLLKARYIFIRRKPYLCWICCILYLKVIVQKSLWINELNSTNAFLFRLYTLEHEQQTAGKRENKTHKIWGPFIIYGRVDWQESQTVRRQPGDLPPPPHPFYENKNSMTPYLGYLLLPNFRYFP